MVREKFGNILPESELNNFSKYKSNFDNFIDSLQSSRQSY